MLISWVSLDGKPGGVESRLNRVDVAFERVPSGMVSPQTQADIDKTFAPDWPNIEYIAANAWSPTKPVGLISPEAPGHVKLDTR